MLTFNAQAFCKISGIMGQIAELLNNPKVHGQISLEHFKELGYSVGILGKEAQELGLPFVLAHVRRINDAVNKKVTYIELSGLLGELQLRIQDEFERRLVLMIPSEHQEFYEQKKPLLGVAVRDKFPQMTEDTAEAGKCFALGRYTACVFHLMRVMESALQELGNKIGVSLANEKNWQNILDEVNKAIKAMNPKDVVTRHYASIASHLFNIKVAWRNEVMHPKATYTPEEAETIFSNVRGFLGELSKLC